MGGIWPISVSSRLLAALLSEPQCRLASGSQVLGSLGCQGLGCTQLGFPVPESPPATPGGRRWGPGSLSSPNSSAHIVLIFTDLGSPGGWSQPFCDQLALCHTAA